ncbi:cellulose synthase catalytic subunit [Streptomyces sp. NPDC045470]|uniref:glycosyltransferase family 2 protein n=1 Tax=unclassified Streptomyces TaxID=2593676 RepID=UPI0033E3D7BB
MSTTQHSFRRRSQRRRPALPAPAAAPAGPGEPAEGPYDYPRFSRLAGPLTDPEPGADGDVYRVRYRSLLGSGRHRIGTALLLAGAPLVSLGLLVWLMQPQHWVHRPGVSAWERGADLVMLISLGLLETFRLVNVASNAHATLMARDPVPVAPRPGSRVALLTSFVPGKEPLAMVRATLRGARAVRHEGRVDVWLLDEGNSREARKLCRELGVRHFSRKNVRNWNQPSGPFRARTKHGNYNAWLDQHGHAYEFMAGVDTDHVPLPEFLERMLGYFRDPDVAFVVGPQVYGNCESALARACESQQFLFHALIQRAGNAYRAPMFVGTNNCIRISALKQVGGLYDSITEDMATGMEIHRHRNPATGHRWRSVYTPDVLAVGEGPAAWSDFFNQQLRWSRGTYETLGRQFPRAVFSLPPGRILNYALMIAYYPLTAVNWMLGGLSCLLFLGLGASGIHIESQVWLMLYSDAAALQIGLYLWNRRHNVSPHEPQGSSGAVGMALSALSAPLYARSLAAAVLRRKAGFVVTAKGDTASPDTWRTFATHLAWAALFAGCLLAAPLLGHTQVAMCVWALMALAIALAPPVLWRWSRRTRPARVRFARPRLTAAQGPDTAVAVGPGTPVITGPGTPVTTGSDEPVTTGAGTPVTTGRGLPTAS